MPKNDNLDDLAAVTRALASPARLRLIEALRGRCLCVNALAARLDLAQSAVSQHLRILKQAGLVTAQRRGYFVHYSLDEERVQKCRERLSKFLEV
ncbi:MAG: metalloregulator ArsR/SmtB family transcription factor [Armatimonadetes bacterium]|nr:metalloregulator ArsR/SmtB family transcription factor [Armatimonadota bacterium]